MNYGTLYGVGVGPGDPRLMTYLAVDTIKSCPVIAVPADGKEKAVAYKIASGIVDGIGEKECLNLSTPMTKDKAVLDAAYQAAADAIIEKLKEGKDVACLTGRSHDLQHLYLYPSSGKGTGICYTDHQRYPLFLRCQCKAW